MKVSELGERVEIESEQKNKTRNTRKGDRRKRTRRKEEKNGKREGREFWLSLLET